MSMIVVADSVVTCREDLQAACQRLGLGYTGVADGRIVSVELFPGEWYGIVHFNLQTASYQMDRYNTAQLRPAVDRLLNAYEAETMRREALSLGYEIVSEVSLEDGRIRFEVDVPTAGALGELAIA